MRVAPVYHCSTVEHVEYSTGVGDKVPSFSQPAKVGSHILHVCCFLLAQSPLWASYPLMYLQSFNFKPYESIVRPSNGECKVCWQAVGDGQQRWQQQGRCCVAAWQQQAGVAWGVGYAACVFAWRCPNVQLWCIAPRCAMSPMLMCPQLPRNCAVV